MTRHVQIRQADPADFIALGGVFHAGVRYSAGEYTTAQRAAWFPSPRPGPNWAARLAAQSVWLAEAGGEPLGFITLMPAGCIDLAYILAEVQGQGLFRRLYAELEGEARALGMFRLWTDASLHAKGPFEAVGFTVTRAETVERGGEQLAHSRMEKTLDG